MDSGARNVETVRLIHAAFNDRDFARAVSYLSPDIVIDYSASRGPFAGMLQGVEAVQRMLESAAEAWEEVRWNAESIEARGDRQVMVVNRVSMRGAGSGAEVNARGVQLWTFGDDVVATGMQLYQGPEDVPPLGS